MKLLGQVIGWTALAAVIAALLYGAIVASLPPVMHP